MGTKVLIISRGAAFMTNALANNLKKAGLFTIIVDANVKQIAKEREDTDIYIIYGGDFVFETSDVLVYLKDICTEDDKKLFVIGYAKEITEIRGVIPGSLIYNEFERPFDMKVFLNEIEKVLSIYEERKNRKNILLVDDDLMFLKMMSDWFSMKYNVTVSKSGMQAITFITKHKPDLVLLDYDMPITSGPQVMEMIRSEPESADIPIIFLTGNSDRESVMRVMALKPQGYLLKNMDRSQIIETVDNFFKTQRWKNVQ